MGCCSSDSHFSGLKELQVQGGAGEPAKPHRGRYLQAFWRRQSLTDVGLVARPGCVTGLIGQNGAGKTTLLDIIARATVPDAGGVTLQGHRLDKLDRASAARWVGRAYQQLRLFAGLSVLENVLAAFPNNLGETLWREVLTPGAVDRQRRQFVAEALEILADFGLSARAHDRCGDLSYGLQKLLSLARLQACRAPVLLLDEPTSGLPAEGLAAVLGRIRSFRDEQRIVILVEHDMEVMFTACDHLVVLNQGRVIVQGTPDQIRRNREVQILYFGSELPI